MADLTYQPAAPARDARFTVLASGLATTAIALIGVYLLANNTEDFNVMGWYANYVLPIGALLVGLVASSGYGIASWMTGQKITRSLLVTVLGLQLIAYFAGQYLEVRSHDFRFEDGTPVGFVTYFDFAARSFAWQQKDGSAGQPLGVWGYLFRLLEIVGFCAGSVIAPLVLRAVPYCESCQIYMKTRHAGLLPASAPARRVKKSDAEGQARYAMEQEEAATRGSALLTTLGEKAAAGDFDGYRNLLAEHSPKNKEIDKLPTRIAVSVIRCPKCSTGHLLAKLRTGHGKQQSEKAIARYELTPTFVRVVSG